MIEVAFNVYPATMWSSLLLQVAHIGLLLALYTSPTPLCNENLWSDENSAVIDSVQAKATERVGMRDKGKIKTMGSDERSWKTKAS